MDIHIFVYVYPRIYRVTLYVSVVNLALTCFRGGYVYLR